ncbi:MAG: HAD hydrolase-like protein [Acetobacterium sp.]
MKYSYILFDLDGTLIDSKDSVRRSFEYALEKMEHPDPKVYDIDALLGPPILDTFQEAFGFTPEGARQAYDYYLEEYVENGQMYGADLYDGVRETISKLVEMGCLVGIATTKNELNAKKIIENLEIDIELPRIFGTQSDGSRSAKEEIISDFLEVHGVIDLSEALMVGDRFYDIQGATEVGIDSVGVTYGCGSENELRVAGATHLISNIEELLEII